MEGFLPPVVAVLLADTKGFRAGMAEAKAEMAGTSGAASKLGGVGKAALLGIAGASLVVGAMSVKMAASFDAAMERVHTQAGASQKEVDSLKGRVLDLAGKTAQAPEQLALSLYHVESAGFRGSVALSMVEAAAKGATIGQADLENVTQAMIATMASGIPGVHGANDALALLNRTVGIGDMKMNGLTAAMSTGILPAARVAGLAFNDVAAALATVTDNAQRPDEAATRLRMSFALMAAPSGAATKALKKMGLGATDLAKDMRKPDGLLVALEDLKKHLETMPGGAHGVAANQALVHAFGGGRSSATIMLLLTQIDRLKTKYAELGSAGQRAKDLQDAWAKTQEQFSVKVEQVKTTVEALAIRLGNLLIPYVIKAANVFLAVVHYFEQNRTAALALAAVVGTVLVAGVVAATVAVVGFIAALVTNPVFLIVAAIAALVVGVKYAWDHFQLFRTVVLDVWHALQAGAGFVMQHKALFIGLGIAVASIIAPFLVLAGVVVALAVRFRSQLGTAFQWVLGVAKGFANWIRSWLGPFVGWWQSRWGQIRTVLQSVWAAMVMVVKVAFNAVMLVLRPGLAILGAAFTLGWHLIVNVVKVAWAVIVTAVKVSWDILSGVVRVAFAVLRGIFEVALDLLMGHWKQAWHDLVAMFSRIFGTIVDAASNVLGTLRQGIVNGVKAFGTLLYQAGKDLITGLINGVKGMVGSAVGAVKNVGSSIVNGVKGIFHIGSPSRLFHQYGLWLMEGLRNGITAGGAMPRLAMQLQAKGLTAAAARVMRLAALDASRELPFSPLAGSSGLAFAGGINRSGFHSLGSLMAGSGVASSPRAADTHIVHTTVMLDRRVLFQAMQEEANVHANRNLTNGLTPVGRR